MFGKKNKKRTVALLITSGCTAGLFDFPFPPALPLFPSFLFLCLLFFHNQVVFALISDWYCGSHRGWQVHADFGFVSYSGESWRKDCC